MAIVGGDASELYRPEDEHQAVTPTTIHIVPHTHWDREWYAPFQVFRARLVQLWDDLLALTESDPAFTFLMDGQTVVIDDFLAIRPEAQPRVDRAIRERRILVGPWYTLPDEFLVSGETLVRNLERGIALGDAHGGAMRVGYLPDSFGHAAQMPQIYRQFGLSHAVVWRGVPSMIDRLAFTWEAPDGSRVLTAYMGTSYSHGKDLPLSGPALALRLRAALDALAPFRPGSDVLLMNGTDHASPQALTAAVAEANRYLKGITVRLARLDEYLRTLPPDGWPHWKGELRASTRANVLMGVLSVRVPDKQAYLAATQNLERRAEPLAALTRINADGLLHEAWTLTLQNAAHDTACGCGIDAVAEEARLRSGAALQLADTVARQGLARVAAEARAASRSVQPGADVVIWNPSPFPRTELVTIDVPGDEPQWVARDHAGSPLPAQLLSGASPAAESMRRALVSSGQVEGCAWSRIRLEPGEAPSPPGMVTTDGDTLQSDLLRCRVEADGTLSVTDLRTGTRYAGLHRLVDEGDAGDEYNFSPPATNTRAQEPVEKPAIRCREAGPLRATLAARLLYRIPVGLQADRGARADQLVDLPLTLRLSLVINRPELDCELELDNAACDHRLRLEFPLPFAVTQSHADGAYHVIGRAVKPLHHESGAPEWELPTYPLRTFVDASDGVRGLALITEGLHEYEIVAGSPPTLALTLLRAVGWLSRSDLRYRRGGAGPSLETPGAQVQGRHRFRYAVHFHAGGWGAADLWRVAESVRLPLEVAAVTRAMGEPVSTQARIHLEPSCLQMTACIPRADGYDLRLLNASDRPQSGLVRLQPAPREVRRVTLGGAEVERLAPKGDGLDLRLGPWEIATLRVVTIGAR